MNNINIVSNATHRERAREALEGKWGKLAGFTLIAMLSTSISNGLSNIEDAKLVTNLLAIVFYFFIIFVFRYGLYYATLRALRGETLSSKILIKGFQSKYYLTFLLLSLIEYFLSLLSILLAFLPVIVYAILDPTVLVEALYTILGLGTTDKPPISFILLCIVCTVLVLFITCVMQGIFHLAVLAKWDGVTDTVRASLKYSLRLLKGYYIKYILLIFSFFGWALLTLCTLGIGIFWLTPYMHTSVASLYETLREGQEQS